VLSRLPSSIWTTALARRGAPVNMPRPQRAAAIAAASQPSFRAELLSDNVAAVEAPEPSKRKAEADAAEPKPKKKKAAAEAKVKPEAVKSEQVAPRKASGKAKQAIAHHAAIDLTDEHVDDDGEVLLGHVISRCVGIQHYHGNGSRYNKEPLHLRRQPNNRYDPNAIAVHTVPGSGGRQVGHVEAKTGDVAAITRVADGIRGIKLVGQVESGAGQVYKFPLRVSFFGAASQRAEVRRLLGYQLTLHEPKPKGGKKGGKKAAASAEHRVHGSAAAGKSGGAAASSVAADDDDDDGLEVVGERTWAERDAELRKHAIVLD